MDFSFLFKPIAYVFILFLGAFLRHIGFIKDEDHKVLSSLVLTLTLPATIIRVFAQVERDLSLYLMSIMGLVFATAPIFIAYFFTRRASKESRAYTMINLSSYNMGCFALPIIENFFGAAGAIVCCMFDVGNGIIAAGGAFAITSTLLKTNPDEPATLMTVIKKLLHSPPFIAYMILVPLNLIGISVPDVVVTIVDPIASANGFLAMFMVGSMFKLKTEKGYFLTAGKLILARYALCAIFALFCIFCTSFDPATKRVLAMVSFAPIAALAPTYTEKVHADGALASFTNSLSAIISLIIMLIIACLPV